MSDRYYDLTRSQAAELDEIRRTRIADRWFNGNEDHAEQVLSALPYSDIPDWTDVDRVMSTIRALE